MRGGPRAGALVGVDTVVSCVGGFGTNAQMRDINGTATVAAAAAARTAGVRGFVFVSAHQYGLPLRAVVPGYFEGKQAAETAVLESFGEAARILRPAAVSGTRLVLGVPVPLWAAFKAWQWVGWGLRPATQYLSGLLDPLTVPPVDVDEVALAAVLLGAELPAAQAGRRVLSNDDIRAIGAAAAGRR
eukprot:TRINITY_DN6682_c0_g1_i1.p4 TRINITY_DN6682_c0_g1~~TRINITY_DN6682_c0_g1_i1.p4  ORF type:complete len:187 (+),score=48.89 TRINITY_DN6682_c0_g1_i1:178-738(+)